jgi:trk system potassium uptake protein TrkA
VGEAVDKRLNYPARSVVVPDGRFPGGVGGGDRLSNITAVFVLIVGCGRVGSSVARSMLREGHEVSCLDEDPEAHARLEVNLDSSWEDAGGQFTVGTALEEDALAAAGIERADAFIASTDGDNTNIVISQIAKRRFNVPTVIARILDPLRAEWYAKQGVNTVCPTRIAIEMLEKEVLEAAAAGTSS